VDTNEQGGYVLGWDSRLLDTAAVNSQSHQDAVGGNNKRHHDLDDDDSMLLPVGVNATDNGGGGGDSVLGWDSHILDKDLQYNDDDEAVEKSGGVVLGWDDRVLGRNIQREESDDGSASLGVDGSTKKSNNVYGENRSGADAANHDDVITTTGQHVLRQDRHVVGGHWEFYFPPAEALLARCTYYIYHYLFLELKSFRQ
jgi:hypothetical protein